MLKKIKKFIPAQWKRAVKRMLPFFLRIPRIPGYDKKLLPVLNKAIKEINQGDIVIISPDPWNNNRWARKQMFAYLLQQYYRNVLYIVDHKQSPTELFSVYRVTDKVLTIDLGKKNDHKQHVRNIESIISKKKLKPSVIISYQSHNFKLAGLLSASLAQKSIAQCRIAYDLTDDWTNFPGFSDEMIKHRTHEEESAIRDADIVLAVSWRLFSWAKKINEHSFLLPNATDYDLLKKNREKISIARELKNPAKPVLGYTGRITPWRIDWDLLEKLAASDLKPTIVMVGEIHHGAQPLVDRLSTHKNVLFLGPRHYYTLPHYYKAFDVCIFPHTIDQQTASMDPIKLYDYMATGKPVVAMAVEEAKKFSGCIYLAGSHEEFIKHVMTCLHKNEQYNFPEQERFAKENSWQKRTSELVNLVKSSKSDPA